MLVQSCISGRQLRNLLTPATRIARSGVLRLIRGTWITHRGGSSGGSAAIIASGMSTLADGTDGGGSIRIPSSACGTVGYKPPFGRNPLDRDHPLESILHYGPIVRSVGDAALMQNVMSGQHADDICSLPEKVTIPERLEGIKDFKIALSIDLGYVKVTPKLSGTHVLQQQRLRNSAARSRRSNSVGTGVSSTAG